MIIYDEPHDVYLRNPAVRSGMLATYRRRPLLFKRQFVTGEAREERKETDALRLGSAVHTLILEGEPAFWARHVQRPRMYEADRGNDKGSVKPWNRNAVVCQEWEAAQAAAGKTVMGAEDFLTCFDLKRAVMSNPEAKALLHEGKPEVTIRRQFHPRFHVQGRIDWLRDDGVIVDLKTIDSLDNLDRAIEDRGYLYQLAYYRWLLHLETGAAAEACYIVAVEKQEPFESQVIAIDSFLLDAAAALNLQTLNEIAHSFETGEWPGRVALRRCQVSQRTMTELGVTLELEKCG